VARFLSPEWLDELAAVLDKAWAGAETADTVAALALGQLVTAVADAPAGEVRYTIHVGAPAGSTLTAGSTEGAGVTLVAAYETARVLASGELSVAEAMTRGEIKVRGDANLLIEMQDGLGSLGEEPAAGAMEALRARTTY
jgi:formylmethanofuran dehydrogenase subunit C